MFLIGTVCVCLCIKTIVKHSDSLNGLGLALKPKGDSAVWYMLSLKVRLFWGRVLVHTQGYNTLQSEEKKHTPSSSPFSSSTSKLNSFIFGPHSLELGYKTQLT